MSATIRRAGPEDMQRLVEMGQRFVNETTYSGFVTINPERLSNTIIALSMNPDATILVSENGAGVNGMIALMVYDHPYSGQRTAFEVVWWVEPEARGEGLKLLSAAEGWARENGAKAMQMVAPTPRVGQLYEKHGYHLVESSYQRSL